MRAFRALSLHPVSTHDQAIRSLPLKSIALSFLLVDLPPLLAAAAAAARVLFCCCCEVVLWPLHHAMSALLLLQLVPRCCRQQPPTVYTTLTSTAAAAVVKCYMCLSATRTYSPPLPLLLLRARSPFLG